MHQLGELDPGTRCMGVFFCAAAGAASSATAGARHTPERAQGKAGAAQPLAAEFPERKRGRVKGGAFARAKRSLV
uniref:Uncharacterized protein n=1 Tax=uncultured prokaryote TaxID=198431 RepID=A0A0H5QI71_9ZZZZ|nr:hypothetical protein [uncultured prokaryote]